MALLVLASIAASTVVGTWVGVRLMRLSQRNGELPELLVGAALFVYAAISQPIGLLQELLPADAPAALRMGLTTARLVGFWVTLVGLAAFVCRVFGPTSRARLGLAAFAALAGLVGHGFSSVDTWSQLQEGPSLGIVGRIGMTPAFLLVYAWSAFESLRYHGLMKRRGALGLADPVVTNRFFVWGAGSAAAGLVLAGLLVSSLLPGHEQTTSLLISASGIVSTAMWWLAFVPPAFYVERLRRGSAPA